MKKYLITLASLLALTPYANSQDKFNFNEISTIKKEDAFECLLLGDTYYGETYQDQLNEHNNPYLDLKDDKGYDTSVKNFENILDDSDLNIANLETTITNLTTSPLFAIGKEFIHYSDVRKTPDALVRHKIHVVSLANNHAIDFGVDGLRQTQALLSRKKIQFFGAGENRKEASNPYLFSFPLKNGKSFKIAIISALQIRDNYKRAGFDFYADKVRPGVFALDVERIKKKVEKLRKHDKDIFIILYPHWGRDYEKITIDQQLIAESLEPLGINAIIGQGAHTAQPIVKKDNKLVAFNLGQFMFNSPGRYEKKRSFAYSFILKLIKPLDNNQVKFRFYPIYGNNKELHYVPRFVGPAEFAEVLEYTKLQDDPNKILGRDKHGFFIQYQIGGQLSSDLAE